MRRVPIHPAVCGVRSSQSSFNTFRQQQLFTITCVTQPLRMNIPTTRVTDVVCASCTSGLTLSNTIHDLCTTLGMMPMPKMVEQHANDAIWYLFSHYSPLQRRPIDEHFAGAPVYESLQDIAAMHKSNIWTLSDAAGAGGTPLPDDLTPRTKRLMLRAIQDAGMKPAQYTKRRQDPPSYAKDLYRAITTATYSAYSVADEEVEEMHGSDGMGSEWATNEALRVLTIDERFKEGWLADCYRGERQLFVRKEYDRIFDALFKPIATDGTRDGRSGMAGTRSLDSNDAYITGTPGIGKTYMSSYYLWRLLSLDEVVGLRYVLYCAGGIVFICDKTNRTATRYMCGEYEDAKNDFLLFCRSSKDETGIILFKCSDARPAIKGMRIPTILFIEPDLSLYKECYYDSRVVGYIVNVWDSPELCAWARCIGLSWSDVKMRYEAIGGVPHFLLTHFGYTYSQREIETAMCNVDMISLAMGFAGWRQSVLPLHEIVKMVGTKLSNYWNEPHSDTILELIMARVRQLRTYDCGQWCHIILSGSVYGKVFRATFLVVCWRPPLAKMMLVKCQPLVSPKDANKKVDKIAARSMKSVGLKKAIKAMEADLTLPRERLVWTQANPTKITAGVLYVPESQNLPLVDAFMLVKGVFIGIQMTASTQQYTTDGLKDFKKIYDKMNISPKHKVIVYVQPPTGPCITTVQWPSDGCDGAGLLSFWADFSQYTFIVDDEFCRCVLDFHDPSIAQRKAWAISTTPLGRGLWW